MSNQLPINPTPTSPLSLGKETSKESPRVLEIDDSFREELNDVLTSVAEPPTKPRSEEPKPSEERDSKVEKPEVEKNQRNPDSKDSPSDETHQTSESTSVTPETEEPDSSPSIEEGLEQTDGLDNQFDPTQVVDDSATTVTDILVEPEIATETAEQLNLSDDETLNIEVVNTEQKTAKEDTPTLVQSETVDPLVSEVNTISEEAEIAVEDESTIDEVSYGETETSPDADTDATDEVFEITETQSATATNSSAANTAAANAAASQASNSSPSKKGEVSTNTIEPLVESNSDTTESISTDEQPPLNQAIQAAPTDNQALDSSAESDNTIDLEAIDDSATSEIENQNSTGDRQVDRLSESRAARQSDTGAPRVDPARFVSRVAKAFESAQQKGGPIEIRLSPPELGSLQVRLEVKEGVLTASLETENQAARNAILDNLPALRERLAEQQIRIEKFDVDVRDDSNPSDGWQQQSEQQGDREAQADRDRHAPLPETKSEADSEESIPAQSTIQLPNNGINLVA